MVYQLKILNVRNMSLQTLIILTYSYLFLLTLCLQHIMNTYLLISVEDLT